ncbi:MAG: PAS domain S-box protein [Deltaproteobacteria bacterium]|nr:PAS domain S-box protein [Deltaproteobacteria bacterium]
MCIDQIGHIQYIVRRTNSDFGILQRFHESKHKVKSNMFQRIADLCRPAIRITKGIIVILDQDGKIISFNEFLESTTGYSYSELTQKNWFDLFIPEKERDSAKRYFQRFILRGKSPNKNVTMIITRGGGERFIQWQYELLKDDASEVVIGLLAVGQDISERVEHEKQLLNERNQLIERNKELTCLYSMAKIVGQNRPLPQMLESIAAIIPPAFQYPEITTAIISLDQHSHGGRETEIGSPTLIENLVIHKIPRGNIEVICSPKKNDHITSTTHFLDEERALLSTIAHHLSLAVEKKEAFDNRAEMENQLRHSDRLAKIGQLTAGVAHELNEPLIHILGFAKLSAKASDLPEQVYSDLDNITTAALHAREVIKKLMFFSRQTPPRETLVNLNLLIEDTIYLFESRCAKNGIAVKKTLYQDLPAIKADISQLQQVFTNLIVNAIQAMPEEGKLSVETSCDEDHVYLLVQDTGIGMTPATLKQIFLPFFTTKDINEGTGLGLSVVHGIVKSHRGSIDVESRIGNGTRFQIKFPLKRLPPEEKQ